MGPFSRHANVSKLPLVIWLNENVVILQIQILCKVTDTKKVESREQVLLYNTD